MSIAKRKLISNSVSIQKLILCIISILVLLLMRDIGNIIISKWIFLIPCAIAFYLLDFSGIVCFLAFFIPIASGLPGTYIFVLAWCALIYKKHSKYTILQIIVPFLVFAGELVHLMNFSGIKFEELIGYIFRIAVISVIVFDRKENIDYQKVLLFFALGVCALISILFISTLSYISFQEAIMKGYRFGNVKDLLGDDVTMAISNNANNVAYYIVIAISAILVLIHNNQVKKILGIFLICVLVISGLLTGSRSFILTLALLLLLYLMTLMKPTGKNIAKLILSIFFIFAACNILLKIAPDMIGNIINRFGESDVTGLRGYIFEQYNDFMIHHPINFVFGVGLFAISAVTGFELAPHNGTQQVWVAYGVVGLSFLIFLIYKMIMNAKQEKKNNLIFYLPLIIIFAFIQTIQFLAPYELMLPLIIGFCSIRLGSTINTIKENLNG